MKIITVGIAALILLVTPAKAVNKDSALEDDGTLGTFRVQMQEEQAQGREITRHQLKQKHTIKKRSFEIDLEREEELKTKANMPKD